MAEPHLFDNDPVVGCAIRCDCESEFSPRTPEGLVNLSAFAVHLFCSTCKKEIELEIEGEEDISDEGNEIEVGLHGSCSHCGKTVMLSISHYNADVPSRSEARVMGHKVTDAADATPAERAVRRNRLWKEGIIK